MTLKEIFDQLTFGEMSQLNLGGSDLGEIDGNNYVRIIPHINLAMTALYKRFNLKQGRVLLYMVPGKYVYELHTRNLGGDPAYPNSTGYLFNVEDFNFNNDIIKIEAVLNQLGDELFLNEPSDMYSIYTPTMNTIRIPNDIVEQSAAIPEWYRTPYLELLYRAKHNVIGPNIDFIDIETVEIDLPDSYLELLVLFIASRIMAPMGAGQFEGLGGNNYMARYEAAAQQMEQYNLEIDHNSQNTRLHEKGWA